MTHRLVHLLVRVATVTSASSASSRHSLPPLRTRLTTPPVVTILAAWLAARADSNAYSTTTSTATEPWQPIFTVLASKLETTQTQVLLVESLPQLLTPVLTTATLTRVATLTRAPPLFPTVRSQGGPTPALLFARPSVKQLDTLLPVLSTATNVSVAMVLPPQCVVPSSKLLVEWPVLETAARSVGMPTVFLSSPPRAM